MIAAMTAERNGNGKARPVLGFAPAVREPNPWRNCQVFAGSGFPIYGRGRIQENGWLDILCDAIQPGSDNDGDYGKQARALAGSEMSLPAHRVQRVFWLPDSEMLDGEENFDLDPWGDEP